MADKDKRGEWKTGAFSLGPDESERNDFKMFIQNFI